ncbi:MAG: class I SAM-dependent methyltransferase [Candidatus Hermodarchaeia archaeon]
MMENFRNTVRKVRVKTNLARKDEVNWIIEHARIQPTELILDVGCGTGEYTSLFAKHGTSAIGLDIDLSPIKRAIQQDFNKCNFLVASAEEIPLPTQYFDAVLGVCAMEHFTHDIIALLDIHRILKPGGRLVMSVDSLSLDSLSDQLKENHRIRNHVINFYSVIDLVEKLERCGYEFIESKYLISTNFGGLLYKIISRTSGKSKYLIRLVLYPVIQFLDRLNPSASGGFKLCFYAEKR